MSMNMVLIAVLAVLVVLYALKRRSRLSSDEN
jgi:hypothetical protein